MYNEHLHAMIAELEAEVEMRIAIQASEVQLRVATEKRVAELEQKLADAWQTIEDVATGAGITCLRCNKTLPCTCREHNA